MIDITFNNRPSSDGNLQQAKFYLEEFRKRTDIGFPRLPLDEKLWAAAEKRAGEIQGIDHYVVVGIGGSSLGGRVLRHMQGATNVHFVENVDYRSLLSVLRKIEDLSSSHWIWISKSGGTLETLTHLHTMIPLFAEQGLKLQDYSTVITGPQSSVLYDWAKSHSIPMLPVPNDIGGRFSVLSPVGMLPAALMGIPLSEIRDGAQWALKQNELVARLMTLAFESWQRQEWITLFWAYCDQLEEFGLWVQQLWAESLAKRTDRKGQPAARVSFPVACVGANDQHSILQQVVEGARDKWMFISRVKAVESLGPAVQKSIDAKYARIQGKNMGAILAAEAEATAASLDQQGVSTCVLTWDDVNARTLGAAFMLMQLTVAGLGEMLNIDAFDQPGVELGKRVAWDLLK